jgi:hypothetical protein
MIEFLSYQEGEDPKKVIFKAIGVALDNIEVFGSRVLVATAPHRNKSKGGILYTDKRLEEGRFQGKVGLILKMGSAAFKYDGQYDWEGPKPEVGDWVYYRPADAWETAINSVPCRFANDQLIVGRVTDPEVIF